MTYNPFLQCPKHGQLRDAYTIIRQWGRVHGTPRQQHASTHVDCEGPFIAALILMFIYVFIYVMNQTADGGDGKIIMTVR